MGLSILRTIVVLVFALLLGLQALAARGLPHRRRAFGLAGLAMLVFAGYNLTVGFGVTSGPLARVLPILSGVLLVAAVISYIVSARRGEMRSQYDRYAARMREYAKRRAGRDKP